MRRSFLLALTLCATGFAVGCGGSSVTGLLVGNSGNAVVTVGAGATPTISWSGSNAARLTVMPAAGGSVAWDVQALNAQSGFAAPVTYGVVPNAAGQINPAAALTSGTDYTVSVTLTNGTTGSKIFRP
jgi:hypothetical protein